MRVAASIRLSTALVFMAAGCHTDEGCKDDTLPAGTRFEVTVTEAVSSVGCASPTAKVGDSMTATIGPPIDTGPDAECLTESIDPPAGVTGVGDFDFVGCLGVPGGYSCSANVASCPEAAAYVDVAVGAPRIAVGQEAESTYQVHLSLPAADGCRAMACIEKFKTRVKRLN